MNRILILIALGAIAAGAYVFFTQGEQQTEAPQSSAVTPAEPITEAPAQTTTEADQGAAQTALEQAQSAAQQASEAAAEAVDQATSAVTETLNQVGEAASEAAQGATDTAAQVVDQATQTASETATQAAEVASNAVDATTEAANDAATAVGDQVAAVQTGAAELYKNWQDNGLLTQSGFDYDKMVAGVEASALNETLKTGVLKVLSGIKAAPETISVQAQALRALMEN